MRFLIRDILLITLVSAIAVFYFVSQKNLLLVRTRLATQEQNVAAEYARYLELVKERDHVQANIDRSRQIEDLANQIESHFPKFQSKYAAVEPKSDSTVSVRKIPMLRARDSGDAVSRIRIWVPPNRIVILKYGIALCEPIKFNIDNGQGIKWESTTQNNSSEYGPVISEMGDFDGFAERGTKFEQRPEYSHSGPYEIRLAAGYTDLDWSTKRNSKGFWVTQLFLNQKPLVTTTFEILNTKSFTSSVLYAVDQLNFSAVEALPELLKFFPDETVAPGVSQAPRAFRIYVWLDGATSGFEPFPEAMEPNP